MFLVNFFETEVLILHVITLHKLVLETEGLPGHLLFLVLAYCLVWTSCACFNSYKIFIFIVRDGNLAILYLRSSSFYLWFSTPSSSCRTFWCCCSHLSRQISPHVLLRRAHFACGSYGLTRSTQRYCSPGWPYLVSEYRQCVSLLG